MNKINLEYLNEISGGDADFISSLLRTYVEETSKDIDSLKDAYLKEDIERIAFWAHKIKASFRMLGLNKLTESAELLEKKSRSNCSLDEIKEHYSYILDNVLLSFTQAEKLVDAF